MRFWKLRILSPYLLTNQLVLDQMSNGFASRKVNHWVYAIKIKEFFLFISACADTICDNELLKYKNFEMQHGRKYKIGVKIENSILVMKA